MYMYGFLEILKMFDNYMLSAVVTVKGLTVKFMSACVSITADGLLVYLK